MTVLVCAVIIGATLYILRRHKVFWLVLVIALWPKFIFQTAMIGSDALQNAFALLLFASLFRILVDKATSKAMATLLAVSAVAVPLIKFTYLPLSFVVLLIPSAYFTFVGARHRSYIRTGIIVLAVILTISWVYAVRDFADSNGQQLPYVEGVGISTLDKVKYSIKNPLNTAGLIPKTVIESNLSETGDYMARIVGYVGFNFTRLPTFVTVTAWMMFILAVLYARQELRRVFGRQKIIFITLLSIMSIILIYATLYVSWTRAGSPIVHGVQGRYFIPLMVWLGLAISFIPVNVVVSKRVVFWIFITLSCINIVLYFFYYFAGTYIPLSITPR